MSLAELQQQLTDYLTDTPEQPPAPALVELIRCEGLAAEQRLAIFRNNVISRLLDALRATFPAVRRLVGNAFFDHAALAYLRTHPPRTRALLGIGNAFPVFLDAFEAAASVPYLGDVARLENLYLESYHSADVASTERQRACAHVRAQLAGSTASSPVRLHPSARLMRSGFAISRIWELNRRDTPIEGPIRLPDTSEALLIIRPAATVEVRRLSSGAYTVLEQLAGGRTLAEAFESAEQQGPGSMLREQLYALADGETFVIGEDSRP